MASKASHLCREGSSTAGWNAHKNSFCALFDAIIIQQTEIRTHLSPLFEDLSNSSSPTVDFIHSRVERMSDQWIQAGLRMKQRVNNTDSKRMRVQSLKFYQVWVIVTIFTLGLQVLLYPGALAGTAGQRFEAMVKRGGPLGELVQWADLSACLTILGHNLTFSTSLQHLHRLPLVTFH